MLRFDCRLCGRTLRVPEELSGRDVACPACRAVVTAPLTKRALAKRSRPPAEDDPDREEHALSKPPPHIDPEELIDMTAMVDIVFFLLIFFLVTSMASVNSSTPLPNPETQQQQGAGGPKSIDDVEAEGDFITVRILRDDSIEVEGVTVQDPVEVTARLKQLRNSSSGATGLLVVGHGMASHGMAVAVLDAGYEAGME
jgi:biopolymer transport protein ExbD